MAGLRDEPVAELATVADSFHAGSIVIEPQVARSRADSIENILRFIAF